MTYRQQRNVAIVNLAQGVLLCVISAMAAKWYDMPMLALGFCQFSAGYSICAGLVHLAESLEARKRAVMEEEEC